MRATTPLLLAALAATACTGPARVPEAPAPEDLMPVYVGTYTDGDSRGIYLFSLDPETGETTVPRLVAESENPSFLAAHPGGRFLYAVNETDDFGGEASGAVTAFAIEEDGQLRTLNQQPSMGAHPCHIVVDGTGRNALVANYNGGNVTVLPIEAEGRLQAPSTVVAHQGSGPDVRRQERPHAHGLALSPDERFALAADLGADRVFVHPFDPTTGGLQWDERDPPSGEVDPGSGPRHVVFHPAGRFAYAINELLSTVTVFAYDAAGGTLHPLQTLTTLPEDFEGRNSTAEIAVSPDGRFVYGSNRGHDTIAAFAVDQSSGLLTAVGHTPTGGSTPRSFIVEPTGRWLLAANQDSDSVVVFRIDSETGGLAPTGDPLTVPRPVSLLVPPPVS